MRTKPSFGDAGLLLRAWAAMLDLSIVALCVPLFAALSNRLSLNVVQYFASEALLGEGITQELVEGCIAALGIALSVSFLGCIFGSAFFLALMEAFTGASFGKHLLGLRVVSASGSYPGISRAMLRQSAKAISWLLAGMGFIMPLWTNRKQALHDKIARCFVVRTAEDLTSRICGAALLSGLLLYASYPAIERSVNQTRARIQTMEEAYRTVGPVATVAWAIVKQGMEDLDAERRKEHER